MTRSKHIGHRVVSTMDRLNVSPLSRNYHLFYICIAEANSALRQSVRRLGRRPSQIDLDRVIAEFCPEIAFSGAKHHHHNAIIEAVDELVAHLQSEQSEMGSFLTSIERVSEALSPTAPPKEMTRDLLTKVIGAVANASKRRIASGNRTLKIMNDNRQEIDSLRKELREALKMANTDPLTGLANRRRFDERMASIGAEANCALILLDIDRFKYINDTYGHPFGDTVLKQIASLLGQTAGEGAFLARTGGEEFSIVLAKTSLDSALLMAERVRNAIEQLELNIADEVVSVTVSIGLSLSTGLEDANELYQKADMALYGSKDTGRNRVTFYNSQQGDVRSNRYKLYSLP